MNINTIEEALRDLRQGKMIILFDHQDRENEGDLVMAAEKIQAKDINFMMTHGRGLICLSMQPEELARLHIPPMTAINRSRLRTAFMTSIEAATGVSTGVSAQDRARTIQVAIHPKSTADDLVMPGHVFPVAAVPGGVFVRQGQTEGSVDLMRLAGLKEAAVICETMKKNGESARSPDLKKIAKKHGLKIITVQQIIEYRAIHDPVFIETASALLPTVYGDFTSKIFSSNYHTEQHMVLLSAKKNNLVRIHSECLTGDVLGSLRCDCAWQLQESLKIIAKEGGVVLYMRHEGRGIGLLNKMKAYALQDTGKLDTVEANEKLGFLPDARTYTDAAQILHQLGLKKIKLLTNNPHKIKSLEAFGIDIVKRVPLVSEPHKHNRHYLNTKHRKLGHLL